jgi:hypothetical protein
MGGWRMELLLTPMVMRAIRRLPHERRRQAFKRIREKGYMKGTAWPAYCFRGTQGAHLFPEQSPEKEHMHLCLLLGRVL